MHQPYATEHMNTCKYGDYTSEQTFPHKQHVTGQDCVNMDARAVLTNLCASLAWGHTHSHTITLQTCLRSFHRPKFSVLPCLHARSKSLNFVGQLGKLDCWKPELYMRRQPQTDDTSIVRTVSLLPFIRSSTSIYPSCEILLDEFQGSVGNCETTLPQSWNSAQRWAIQPVSHTEFACHLSKASSAHMVPLCPCCI